MDNGGQKSKTSGFQYWQSVLLYSSTDWKKVNVVDVALEMFPYMCLYSICHASLLH